MCNMKALPLLVRKLWLRLKFFKSRSNGHEVNKNCQKTTTLAGRQPLLNSSLKPRSHALIYTRYVNYTYMYNLHPGVKIYLLRVHMFLNTFGLNRA